MAEAVVDSDVWVAALVGGEPRSAEALRFLTDMTRGLHRCHLPRLVLVETCAAVARRSTRDQQARVVRALASFRTWEKEGHLLWYDLSEGRSLAAVEAANQFRLNGGDAIVAALALELRIPLMSFDHHFLRLPPDMLLP